jgi:hypothetical protein
MRLICSVDDSKRTILKSSFKRHLMKILGILIAASLFLSFASINQESKECLADIKEGTFYYYSDGEIVKVIRTKTHQYEKYKDGKVENALKWMSEDTYELTFLAENSTPGCLQDGDKMIITLTDCKVDSYVASITSEKCGSGKVPIYRSKKVLKEMIKKYKL